MTTPYVALNGEQIASLELTIPYVGLWVADVGTGIDVALSDAATISIGSLSLVGHVARTAGFAGSRTARIMGGYGGWRRNVGARMYRSADGVKLSTVLGDAAIEVGEKISIATDRTIGSSYARADAPASDVLRQLVGDAGWFVQVDGTTRVGPRTTGAITSPFQVIAYTGGKGRFEIATEAPEDWMPGRSFTAPTVTTAQTIRSVTHRADTGGRARLDVLTMESPLLALVRAAFPFLRYLGRKDYVVQSTDGTTVDVIPFDENAGLPPIPKCPLLPGLLGERVSPAAGSRCLVEFVGGDPTRAIVTGGDYANAPTYSKIAGGGPLAARKGDAVDGGTFIIGNTTTVKQAFAPGVGLAGYYPASVPEAVRAAALSATNTADPPASRLDIAGSITGGSSIVEIGG